jgi:hypothetical protein
VILTRVRDIVRRRESATFSQILVDSGASGPIVREALDFWVRKGQVRVLPLAQGSCPTSRAACGGCPMISGCPAEPAETHTIVYGWVRRGDIRGGVLGDVCGDAIAG